MVIALAQSPSFILSIAVCISLLVLSSAARSRNHHETAAAFVDRTSFLFSGGTARRSSVQLQSRRGSRRWPTPKRSIVSTSTTQWSIPPEIEDSGEEGGDGGMDGEFVPTEELLDDPSYVEQILSAMGRLAPAVPPVDKTVFQAAVKHHCALRTSNIIRAMRFYSLLGMKEVVRFRADSARCAFLEGAGIRLELIEVPASMQPADKAPDLTVDMRSTGLNHIAFDVGPAIEAIESSEDGLRGFLTELNRQSEEMFGMSVRLAVSPFEQRIGQDVYDVAFITDADGVLLELLHRKITLDMDMPQAW